MKASYEEKMQQQQQQTSTAESSDSAIAVEAARQQERSVCDMRWRARYSMLERRVEGQREQITQLRSKIVALGGQVEEMTPTTPTGLLSGPTTPVITVAPELSVSIAATAMPSNESHKRPLPVDEDIEMTEDGAILPASQETTTTNMEAMSTETPSITTVIVTSTPQLPDAKRVKLEEPSIVATTSATEPVTATTTTSSLNSSAASFIPSTPAISTVETSTEDSLASTVVEEQQTIVTSTSSDTVATSTTTDIMTDMTQVETVETQPKIIEAEDVETTTTTTTVEEEGIVTTTEDEAMNTELPISTQSTSEQVKVEEIQMDQPLDTTEVATPTNIELPESISTTPVPQTPSSESSVTTTIATSVTDVSDSATTVETSTPITVPVSTTSAPISSIVTTATSATSTTTTSSVVADKPADTTTSTTAPPVKKFQKIEFDLPRRPTTTGTSAVDANALAKARRLEKFRGAATTTAATTTTTTSSVPTTTSTTASSTVVPSPPAIPGKSL
ncbi:hypothetical protein BDF22DRAFT_5135 [Syncephalis plumigaleata]|nr:hypothetical protein BDF22DRAFT_5135 [Syncephalis plumigaleata]